jgi:putative cardiolipin synthase
MKKLLPFLFVLLTACAGPQLKEDLVRDPPGYAAPPAESGLLHDMAQAQFEAAGPLASGFRLLDHSEVALRWRLALIDSAVSSLDIQTYLWYPDHSGRLLLDRAIRAADRGVKVRLLVDDLLTIGQDQVLFELERHPNIEFRLFNPWGSRGMMQRAGEMVVQMERLNTRMHDKLLIADGNAAVVGGRNLGDHYFGLNENYNFHDLDLLGFGHIARQANGMFDHFWNSEWVVSAKNLDLEPDATLAKESLAAMREKISTAPQLERFSRLPKDWTAEMAELEPRLRTGTSTLIYDETTHEEVVQNVANRLFSLLGMAQEELLITNAYIIPGQPAIDFVKGLTDQGVTVRILTNSLASHDVPAVNSHYKRWRDDFIEAGAELYELRSDPAIQRSVVEVPPVRAEFVGLHTKSFVVDRRYAFVGSMNFDPRSVNINTEAGAFIDSPELAQDLAEVMTRDMAPENAWHVQMDSEGDLSWVNAEERVTRQPARSFGQRIMDAFFRLFPKSQY